MSGVSRLLKEIKTKKIRLNRSYKSWNSPLGHLGLRVRSREAVSSHTNAKTLKNSTNSETSSEKAPLDLFTNVSINLLKPPE